MNVELTKHITTYMEEGVDRVGSDFLSAIPGRIGSGQRFARSGRVQENYSVITDSGKSVKAELKVL